MLPQRPEPDPPRARRGGLLFTTWLISIVVIVVDERLSPIVKGIGVSTAPFSVLTFFAALVCIALTLYGITIAARWMLRKLFWRVGRRLFLSYVLIGVLPFFLFAILLLTLAYMVAGVTSAAAWRGERQASLGQLESAALEFGLTGQKPAGALPSLEVYDTASASAAQLPAWLRQTSFSGMVWRERKPLLVATRQFPKQSRTVVFVQPMNREWSDQLADRTGMIVRLGRESENAKKANLRVRTGAKRADVDIDVEKDDDFEDLLTSSIGRRIVWGDLTAINEWETGKTDESHQLFTLIVNPISSLTQFYFGAGSDRYIRILANVIGGVTAMLLFMYMIAALFAAVLIYSITRAVNRIEKGTKAVERGDFTYRIGMRPQNQLGEMAQSFDHMTESIASLLTNVAEKERLQSEIAIAATIQRNLLPKEGPRFGGVSFSAHFEPTASIGGDYYDVFNLDKSKLAVTIGDVSGHGLSTGLVMAMVKAAITTLVEEGAEEEALFHRLNDLVYRSTERRAFMTLAFTIFDLEKGTIRHTNAGHLYPYLLRNGEPPRAIEVPSLPLGVRAEIRTRTSEVDLKEGDALVYLSDGIIEAQDANGEPFGFHQLEALLAATEDRSPSGLRDAILEGVARHSGMRPADDDRTVMVLRFDQFRSAIAPVPATEAAAV